MAGGRRNFGRELREEYEKAMSLADGKNVYIGKIAEGIRHRLEKDVKKSRTEMDDMLKNFRKYQKPEFWRNDAIRGGNIGTGYVGKTVDGVKINKKECSGGGRIYIGRYCHTETGKFYVILLGYLKDSKHDDFAKEENRISSQNGAVFDLNETEENPDEIAFVDDGSIIIDQGSFFSAISDGELTDHKLKMLTHQANITITNKQFKTIGLKPPLLIDGHAGSGKSIILALRIAFQFKGYDKHFKTTRDPPRLLVVAYNQRVLNMIQDYVDYWMNRLIDEPDQYRNNIEFIPTLTLYHSLVKKMDHENIPDPMSMDSHKRFVSFYRFETEFFSKIMTSDVSAEQAWHFIRGILKGQGFGWYGNEEISIKDFASIHPGGRIARKFTELMPEKLVEELLAIFHRYENWRHDEGLIDDIDLVRRAFTAINAEAEEKPEDERPFMSERLNRYDDLFVDEAQDLTSKEFELLTHLLRESPTRIVVGGDPLQTINPTGFSWNSLETFLYTLIDGMASRSERMLVSHRLPKKLVDFSNVIIQARSGIKEGDLDLMEAADRVRNEGFIAKVSYDQENAEERGLIEEILTDSLASNTGILLWARDSSELREKTELDTILVTGNEYEEEIFDTHSIESVKGLEYDTIILYRFGDLDTTFNGLNINSLTNGDVIEPKPGETYKMLYHLNRLFIAASRAKKNIYIIDGVDSVNSAWNEKLWGSTIEHTLTVKDLREQIDLTPSLDKSRNYFQKGKEDRNLDLLRKAYASAMPCPDSEEKTRLVREIRITIIRMEINSTPTNETSIIKVKQTELVKLFEEVGRVDEAIALRAEMEEWEYIYSNYKDEKAPLRKLFWEFSNLDSKYPSSVMALSSILKKPNLWKELRKNHPNLTKKLRARLRDLAFLKIKEIGDGDLEALSDYFGFQPDDFVELLKPTWDTGSQQIKTNKELLNTFERQINAISPDGDLTKLSDRQYIKYLKICLDCPNLSESDSGDIVEKLAERNDHTGVAKMVARLVFHQDLHLLHHNWEKLLTILSKQDVDPELQSDFDNLLNRLRQINSIKLEYSSTRAAINMDSFNKACNSYKKLQNALECNSHMPFFKDGVLSGKKYTKGEVYVALKEKILHIKAPDLSILGQKWISAYGRKNDLLADIIAKPVFKELRTLFEISCPKELVQLAEGAINKWERVMNYDSPIVNEIISYVDSKKKIHLLRERKYVENVEEYVSSGSRWELIYEKQEMNTIHPWVRNKFSPKNKQIADLCVWYRKGDWETMEKSDLNGFHSNARKWGLTVIQNALAEKMGLEDQDPAPSRILQFDYAKVASMKYKEVKAILDEYSEELRKNISWEETGWYSSKSIPVQKKNIAILNELQQKNIDTLDIILIGASITKSFTQIFCHIFKEYGAQRLPGKIRNALIKDQDNKLEDMIDSLTGEHEFWQLVKREDSFLDYFIPQNATNSTLAIGALLETIMIWDTATNKDRIAYLKNLEIKVKSNAPHAEVVQTLMEQDFVKHAIDAIDYEPKGERTFNSMITEMLSKK